MARTLEVHESMRKPALLSSPRTRRQTCVINMVSTTQLSIMHCFQLCDYTLVARSPTTAVW